MTRADGHPDIPSPTTARLALLLAAVLACTTVMHNLTFYSVMSRDNAYLRRWQTCALRASENAAPGRFSTQETVCMAPYERAVAWWIVTALLALLLLAAALYALFPRWRQWRDVAGPLPDHGPQPDPLRTELSCLVELAGLRKAPEFLSSPRPSTGAVTFGRMGRYRIRLNIGLQALLHRDPQRFRAVVLHELAHVRHRDAHTHYLAKSVWWAFIVTAVIPVPLSLLTTDRITGPAWLWRLLALTAMVHLLRTALLHIREYQADLAARGGLKDPSAMERALTAPLTQDPAKRHVAWRRFAAPHPSPRARLDNLADPDRRTRIGFWESLAAGVTASLAVEGIHQWLILAFPGGSPLGLRWIAALLPALLVGGVIAAGAWRAAGEPGHDAPGAGIAGRTVGSGLGLAAGLLAGYRMAPATIFADVIGPSGTASLAVWAVLGVSLAVLTTLAIGWIEQCARLWRSSAATWRSWRAGAVALALLLSTVLAYWPLFADFGTAVWQEADRLAVEEFRQAAGAASAGPYWAYAMFEHPVVTQFSQWRPALAASVVVWVLPLSAPGVGASVLADRTVRLGPPTAFLVYAAGSTAARLLIRARVSDDTRFSEGFTLAFGHWSVVGAVALAVLVAHVVLINSRLGASPPNRAVPAAVFAGYAAALFSAAALFTVNSGFRCADGLAAGEGCTAGVDGTWVLDTTARILVLTVLATALTVPAALLLTRGKPMSTPSPTGNPRTRNPAVPALLGAGLCLVVYGTVGEIPAESARESPAGIASPIGSGEESARKACTLYAEVLASAADGQAAEVNANLLLALRLASDSGDPDLAQGLRSLMDAGMRGDAAEFAKASSDTASACLTHGVPIR
ncbi:M48 family metalloprotease [Streptomyces sp. PA03-1a]|nr:M48 family metalloprotease [Streptomyces sp. PA03-1a]MDX2817132.1 M48 family metalloprotease [Streptomyces sp. PA03-5A]